jgi:DNA-binding NtrC family response regulator
MKILLKEDGEMTLIDIPKNGVKLTDLVDGVEFGLISYALSVNKNNKTHAANWLGIKRTTLVMKCRNFGIIREKQCLQS